MRKLPVPCRWHGLRMAPAGPTQLLEAWLLAYNANREETIWILWNADVGSPPAAQSQTDLRRFVLGTVRVVRSSTSYPGVNPKRRGPAMPDGSSL